MTNAKNNNKADLAVTFFFVCIVESALCGAASGVFVVLA